MAKSLLAGAVTAVHGWLGGGKKGGDGGDGKGEL